MRVLDLQRGRRVAEVAVLVVAVSGCRDDAMPNAEGESSGGTVVDTTGTTGPEGTSSTTEGLASLDGSGTSRGDGSGDSSSTTAGADETSVASDESGVADVGTHLVIAAEPIDAWTEGVALSGAFTVGLGAEYPRVVSGGIGVFESSCRIDVTDVDFSAIEGGDGIVRPLGADGTTWTLEALREGITTIRLRGHYDPVGGVSRCGLEEEALPIALEVTFTVSVRAPADIALDFEEACPIGGARLWEGRTSVSGLVRPVDGDGTPFSPRNATAERSVSVRVSTPLAEPIVLLDEAKGLASLRVPRVPELELRLDGGGPVHRLAVYDPADVTDVSLSFVLPGYAGNPLSLIDGETYGEGGFGRTLGHVFPQVGTVMVDGEAVCDGPDVDWFTLTSTTPETCVVVDPTPIDDSIGVYNGGETTVSAEVVGDGRCAVALEGPELGGGEGLGATLDVTFVHTEELAKP